MFQFLKKIFSQNNSDSISKKLEIKKNNLFYWNHESSEKVNLKLLKYAYVEILGGNPYLFLFDYQQHYIPCQQEGFDEIYSILSKQFGFNDHLFCETIKSNQDQKKRIYLKKELVNFHILEEEAININQGFEILSSPPQIVSWDISYEDFYALNVSTLYNNEFDIPYRKINFPVKIGSIVIDVMEFYDNFSRKDIPIQSYFAELRNEEQTDESFNDLKKYLNRTITKNKNKFGYERPDQRYLGFKLTDILFSICYTYDTESGYNSGFTSFSIDNERDYSDLILKERNDLKKENIKSLSIGKNHDFIPDYKKYAEVSSRPQLLRELYEKDYCIYYNKENETIGFSSEEFTIEFRKKDLSKCIIQNVLPAKGGGYSEFLVVLKPQEHRSIFYARENEFDHLAVEIEEVTGIAVEIPEPYYNC